ncbi:hypothetical protein [Blautia sp.]|uniref:hypothetical protein n=1 Tax=Blautia sp. TaxID=1955243 RepID=UPI00258574F5|nr:hypothetical protein [Blautia sp.]
MEQKRKRVRRRVTSIFLALLLCVSSAMTVLADEQVVPDEKAAPSEETQTSGEQGKDDLTPKEDITETPATDTKTDETENPEDKDSEDPSAGKEDLNTGEDKTTSAGNDISNTNEITPPPIKSEEQMTSPSPAVSSPENTEKKKEQPAPETATAAVPAVQAAASYPVTSNTNIQINIAYTFNWSGTGTESDPFYFSTKSGSSKDTFIAQTTDEFATINGQVHTYTEPLSFGANTIDLTVVSSDKSATVHYRIEADRTKKQQGDWPKFLVIVSPSKAGEADGKFAGLDMERTYEYKLKGTQQWIEVPAGSAEITGLKAGDYDVRYGATDEYSASYNSKTFTILDPVTRSIKVADSLPDDIKNMIEIPSSANAGSTVTLKMKFSELTFVEEIIVTATKNFGGWTSQTDTCLLSQGEPSLEKYDGNNYEVSFTLPDGECEITSVKLRQGDWHTISHDIFKLNVTVTPSDPSKVVTKNDISYYEKGSEVKLSVESNQNVIGTSKVTAFRAEGKSQTAGTSPDGSPIKINVNEDLTVLADIEMILADFTYLDELLNTKVPNDFTIYTDDSWSEVDKVLSLVPNMKTVTQNNQSWVDDYVRTLIIALDNLEYRDGNYTELIEAQNRVPKDLSLYTPESVKALQEALEASKQPIDEQWNMSKRDEMQTLADNLNKAVDSLRFIPGDYTELEKAQSRVPKDLSIYTPESVKALQEALVASRQPAAEKWDISRSDEIHTLAENLNKAVDGLKLKPADYTKVEEARKKVPNDLSLYTKKSADELQKALDSVVEGLDITQQEKVDRMAEAIENAIKGLEKKSAEPGKTTAKSPKTGDESSVGFWLAVSLGSAMLLLAGNKKRGFKRR